MKCKNCLEEIGECKVCPFCNNSIEETTPQEQIKQEAKKESKSNFLFWFQMTAIILLSIGSLIMLICHYYIEGVYLIIILAIVCILCKTFSTIIDLLQSIDEKL